MPGARAEIEATNARKCVPGGLSCAMITATKAASAIMSDALFHGPGEPVESVHSRLSADSRRVGRLAAVG